MQYDQTFCLALQFLFRVVVKRAQPVQQHNTERASTRDETTRMECFLEMNPQTHNVPEPTCVSWCMYRLCRCETMTTSVQYLTPSAWSDDALSAVRRPWYRVLKRSTSTIPLTNAQLVHWQFREDDELDGRSCELGKKICLGSKSRYE